MCLDGEPEPEEHPAASVGSRDVFLTLDRKRMQVSAEIEGNARKKRERRDSRSKLRERVKEAIPLLLVVGSDSRNPTKESSGSPSVFRGEVRCDKRLS